MNKLEVVIADDHSLIRLGLKSMKERANLINAKLNIAALEKGTKITLKLKHE